MALLLIHVSYHIFIYIDVTYSILIDRKLVPVLSSIIPIIFVLVLAIILVSTLLVIANCQKKKRNKKSEKTLKVCDIEHTYVRTCIHVYM